jgi:accessory gene regulator protein AgrB
MIAVVIVVIKLTPQVVLVPASIVLAVVGCMITFLFAPVEHYNRPLSSMEIQKFRKSSRLGVIICAVIGLALLALHMERYGLCLALALGTSGLTQLIGVSGNIRR